MYGAEDLKEDPKQSNVELKEKHKALLSKLQSTNPASIKLRVPSPEYEELKELQRHKPDFPCSFKYEPPRYDLNDSKAWLQSLDECGYAVIKNIITPQKVNQYKSDIWDWMEQLEFPNGNKIDRRNPESWRDGNWPSDPRTGIVFSFGAGQTPFMWDIRIQSNVRHVYRTIWNTDDLIVSFDGFNLFRPFKYDPKFRTSGKWWHTDQNARNPNNRGFQAVQSIVLLHDADSETGGFVVIPKSHLAHAELCKRLRWPGGDFVPLPRNDPIFQKYPNGGVMLQCKAGDLIIWDARLLHCSEPSPVSRLSPQKWNEPKDGWDLIRMAMYVCLGPRYKATSEVLQKRQSAFELHNTTTHWPHFYVYRLGAGYVPHKFELNEEQKLLVGKPRTAIEDMFWQLRYEYNITPSNVVLGLSCVAMFTVGFNVAKKWWNTPKK